MIWIWGWHAVEAIKANNSRKIYEIHSLSAYEDRVRNIFPNSRITFLSGYEMDKLYGRNHQGIAVLASQIKFYELKEWIDNQKKSKNVCLVACDLIEDAQNLGAIIRTSKALNANGLLVLKRKSAPFNGNLCKAASGAVETLPIIQVSNLATSLSVLKENGYRVYGLDHRGSTTWSASNKSVIVLGQEGAGLRNLTRKICDDTISIQTNSEFQVLNVSVAAGIILYKFLAKGA